MSASRMARILKEFKKLQETPSVTGMYDVTVSDNNVEQLQAFIYGPEDTPYYGYKFEVVIKFTDEYPFKPVVVSFITKIKHVNIYGTGICLNILKAEGWSPIMTVNSVLVSLVNLLGSPNFSDALDMDLKNMYDNDKNKYETYVKNYCKEN